MSQVRTISRAGLLFVAALAILASPAEASDHAFVGQAKLKAQSEEFRREVIHVAEGVYVAVGYSASNVTLVQGRDGVIIIDTSANPTDARTILEAFGNLVTGPVKGIIYTHSHPDHTGGASIFAGASSPEIWSQAALLSAIPDIGRANRDGGDQFGISLPPEQFINAGVQQEYGRVTPPTREGYLRPNHTFNGEQQDITIAGVSIALFRTPGESPDSITIWLPEQRVAITGDNVLKSFPNISPIRGARFRSPEDWIASLEKLIELQPMAVVPGHTRPVKFPESQMVLIAYRDGIREILTQTLAGMRMGERPDELVSHVKLPDKLAQNPWLTEFYGSVEWFVRGIYADRVGWFDGNATNLFPLSARERTGRMQSLLGGRKKVLAAARQAIKTENFQWGAELADVILVQNPNDAAAKVLKADALTALAERQVNAIARNYYLTVAQNLRKR